MNSENRQDPARFRANPIVKVRELEAARRISEVLFQQHKIEDIVGEALQIALDIVDAEAGSVLLANTETKELEFYHSIGQSPVKPGTSIPWDPRDRWVSVSIWKPFGQCGCENG